MHWDDIYGHRRQLDVLRTAIASRRTAHAYLFVGESGVGKGTVADVFTRALTCRSDGASERPCGACSSCRRLVGEHPDVLTVTPEGASIKIDQVRAVQRELLFRPTLGRMKVIRFDPADQLTEEAQNALLKSLEEPPEFACFILLSRHQHALLPTIRSRCTQIRFGRVSASEIASALQAKGHDREKADTLAALAFGRPGTVLGADVEELLQRRKQVIDWAEILFRDPCGVWYVGEAIEKERNQAALLLDLFIVWLRDLLLVCSGRSDAVTNRDMLALLEQRAEKLSPVRLTESIGALLTLKEQWEANANFRLALDVALIRIQRRLRSA